MTKIHDSATCTAGFNSRPCDMCQFAEKAAQRAEHEEIVSPRAENVSSGQETPRIDPYEYLRTFKYAPPDAESEQPAEIAVPTFDPGMTRRPALDDALHRAASGWVVVHPRPAREGGGVTGGDEWRFKGDDSSGAGKS